MNGLADAFEEIACHEGSTCGCLQPAALLEYRTTTEAHQARSGKQHPEASIGWVPHVGVWSGGDELMRLAQCEVKSEKLPHLFVGCEADEGASDA